MWFQGIRSGQRGQTLLRQFRTLSFLQPLASTVKSQDRLSQRPHPLRSWEKCGALHGVRLGNDCIPSITQVLHARQGRDALRPDARSRQPPGRGGRHPAVLAPAPRRRAPRAPQPPPPPPAHPEARPAHTCRRVTQEPRVPARAPVPTQPLVAPRHAHQTSPRVPRSPSPHTDQTPARRTPSASPPPSRPARAARTNTRGRAHAAPQRAGPRRAPPRTSSPTLGCPTQTGRSAGEGKDGLVPVFTHRRAAPAPSARCFSVRRGDARSPRFSAGYGGDVAGALRGEGGSLPPVSPSRSRGTPETKNKINKLSPPPPSPKTTTQTLEGPPRAPLHWPQGGCLRLSMASFCARQAAVPPLQFRAAAVAPHWLNASRLTS
ncbi:uncharacterized protein LOC134474834 [Cavia porcellus]|uniref:uncharacterized protein LOC134474834 n=1 Tax=Cavia porcellus TaxID=10141 RepID=UPI002FE3FAD0